MILGDADLDRVTRPEFALQDFLRQRVFDLLLDRPFEWPRTVHRIKAGLSEPLPGSFGQDYGHFTFREPRMQITELNIDDRANVFLTQRMEYDHIVDPVNEFRPEMARDDFHHRGFHRIVILFAGQFLDAL